MRRLGALLVVAAATAGVVGCSGSDEDPGPITRIDGPATVDEEILNGGGDDGSSDG